MNQGVKILLGVIGVIVLFWIGYAIGSNPSQPGSDNTKNNAMYDGDTYRIGALLPLTGDAAAYGEPARNVYELAVDEINAAGGIDGKMVELVIEDSKCNGRDATNAVQKLINVDNIKLIIGGFCSSESLAAVPVAEAAGDVLLLSSGSSSPDLTGVSPVFFRNYPSDAAQAEVLASIANDKGYDDVAIIYEQTDYAQALGEAFADNFENLGGTTYIESFATETKDFRTQIAKLQAENPDALFVSVQTLAVGERVLQQVADLNWAVQLMGSDPIVASSLPQDKPELVEGMFAAQFGYDENSAKYQHLATAYQAAYNKDLEYKSYAQTEYDAVYLLADAIAAVGYDAQAVAQWFRDLENWEGVSGVIEFADTGDRAAGGHRPEVVENGQVKPL